jgi:hypothetical protein
VPILIVNGLRNLMIRIIFLNQKEAVPLFKIFNPQNMIIWGNSTGHSSTSPLANGGKIYNSQTNTRYLLG